MTDKPESTVAELAAKLAALASENPNAYIALREVMQRFLDENQLARKCRAK